ncbi:ABC transporter substrate-binding protein [Aetokthonos hydrillicola Thurmond2011]|jgi:ABC-type branched-subunit amino acid transport system substrate-binding protein|uniref:ABC transporter substrate-binding protein n=1 Tax=Aetokthonos hydrillicola Thurmond2011 TaxID=2712845 RepID=A0AAP5I4B8_9CYAN|nr:ABC transporter substrate-binding protein [Aetokthonos hydrillicola]MBO3461783.1 ABC transporter substrate-binding protein [Aetokthonos hydrillicola CCALA 1050]MBW4590247.1 ABC transporter substrate-binding protein [Aetokthonos hydrillicola CCALA 1050]MDR9894818.1 ABC transporter substrate-binding protein [Aetokthonos hydrillicola Thurmond2011]
MTYSTPRRNPHVIGRPIGEEELFFGRESLFHFIEDNLKHDEKVILLHGQRRIGKSSVLRNIPNFVAPDRFLFVPFDLQDKSQQPLSSILHALAAEILSHLDLDADNIKLPNVIDLEKDPYIFARQFLPQVYKILDNKELVLLLDEFDAFSDGGSDSAVANFFAFLKYIATIEDRLFIILFAGRKREDLPTLLGIFKGAPFQEIGLLDELSAKRLIIKPAEGILEYKPEAIQAILDLSSGHPYFTQVICFALFGRARELENWVISRTDVESVVDKAIENAEAGLVWFWEGLSIPERVVFSAVADAQQIANSKTGEKIPEDPLTLLKDNYGVIPTNSLIQAADQLAKQGFLDKTGRRVKVEFIRRWLVLRHPLLREISQLEELEQEQVNPLWEEANRVQQNGKIENIQTLYHKILEINPNHFSTVVSLANEYLKAKDFDKAVELYRRAYKFDPIRNDEGVIRALQASAQELINQGDFIQAKEYLNEVLEFEPDNRTARLKLLEAEVEAQHTDKPSKGELFAFRNRSLGYYKSKSFLLATIAGTIGITTTLIAVGINQISNSCSTEEQKAFRCAGNISNSISYGDRTLFPKIENITRDQGIEAFKQRKYLEAAEIFKKAIADDRRDPELLIYYNNARAREQGSPLTLAAVVSVESSASTAREILRGVAQAQNEFNNKGGSDGRLLQIAIANDGNKQDKAKQVAQELANDSSILGVIGHDATQVALSEYEKANLAIISPTDFINSSDSSVLFTTVPSGASTAKKLAEYASRKLEVNKVAIFYTPESTYSDALTKEFIKNFEKLKGRIVFKSDLAEAEFTNNFPKSESQALVFFPDKQQTSVALQKIARLPNSNKRVIKFLGSDTLYDKQTLTQGSKAVEGLILAVPWFRDTPKSKSFANRAAKEWGGDISWRTASSYDAAQAFIKAFSSSLNPSRKTILQKLQDLKLPASNTSGEILEFTEQRERQIQPVLVTVKEGKFVLLK